MIDIGINLGNEAFDHDRAQVIENAKEHGVEFIILTGSCLESNALTPAFARDHPDFARATVGIHPHHADMVTPEVIASVDEGLTDPMVVAVGETGLDFFRDISDRKKQEAAFIAHIELAIKHGKPLFLHQRDSHSRFLPIMKEYRHHLEKAVVHCFTDSKEALFDYLDLDLHIGITGWLADERRGSHLIPLMTSIPRDRLMIETDGPYLLPRNIRPKPKSRRNEPKYLPYVALALAQALQTDTQAVQNSTCATARAFFDLPSPQKIM